MKALDTIRAVNLANARVSMDWTAIDHGRARDAMPPPLTLADAEDWETAVELARRDGESVAMASARLRQYVEVHREVYGTDPGLTMVLEGDL